MFGIGVRCLENATLLGGPNYKCHIKSQPFEIAYNKAIVAVGCLKITKDK